MAAPNEISLKQLSRLIGTPAAPTVVDVRIDEDVELDPTLIPTARRFAHTSLDAVLALHGRRKVVVYCQRGLKLSHGAAAWLRARGVEAEVLQGGHLAWRDALHMTVPIAAIPTSAHAGPTRWVTRQRPKIDRLACPWLIRRFIDPDAELLFVPARDVLAVAERFDAEPFDVEGATLGHREQRCTFDALCERFTLYSAPLQCLAEIVRAADLGQPQTVPEANGLLAVSLGLSRLYRDDNAQVDAGMLLYDALYRWARDAREEQHLDAPNDV